MATVKSIITVSTNVTISIIISLFGLFNSFLNERHSLILYETISKIAESVGIGIKAAHLPKKSMIKSKTIA